MVCALVQIEAATTVYFFCIPFMMLVEKSIISDYGIGSRWIGQTKNRIQLSTEHDAFAEVDEGQSEVGEFHPNLKTFIDHSIM